MADITAAFALAASAISGTARKPQTVSSSRLDRNPLFRYGILRLAFDRASRAGRHVSMRKDVWPLQEAQNHFSEVVDKALADGPQTITLHRLQRAQGRLVELDLELARPVRPARCRSLNSIKHQRYH